MTGTMTPAARPGGYALVRAGEDANVIEHPERAKARQRGELAARMVTVACELACLVRDSDREAIGEFITGLTADGAPPLPAEVTALLIVQAAMIPVDVPASDLLSWVGWDDDYVPSPVPVPAVPVRRRGQQRAGLKPCGTWAAYSRHKDRGELVDDACEAAKTAYFAARYQRQKAGKPGGRAASAPRNREDSLEIAS
jgi:hypothetical protein